MAHPLQPALHDLVTTVRAPAMAISHRSGQIRGTGVDGFFVSDRRVLSTLLVEVDGEAPEPLATHAGGPGHEVFQAACRHLGDDLPDPTVMLRRSRRVHADQFRETLEFTSTARRPVTATSTVRAATDLAAIAAVKDGHASAHVPASPTATGLRWDNPTGGTVELACEPRPARVDGASGILAFDLALDPGETRTIDLTVRTSTAPNVVFRGAEHVCWARPEVASPDHRLARLVDRSLDDLQSLLLYDGADPFLAAGGPWFLTLFGRDSLWAARMLLPLGTDLALGTLQTLARRQGTTHDTVTAAAPGKVLHEVRQGDLVVNDLHLPATYYGTVDATPLWILLLVDTWRAGAAEDQVERFLPAMQRALDWLYDHADADGDGLIEYLDENGRGLANQGWKDSGDAIQYADGRIAEGPIALCEVQAYAVEAARGAAALLGHFDRPGADRALAWADALTRRFRDAFWVEDDHGPYPAVALDRDKQPVDALTSNIGHLLGTGILTPGEAKTVAARLAAPDMSSGYGLRTLSATAAGYSPYSYHGGTVWPHDTAIAATGLCREGMRGQATDLLLGLLAAASHFDYRLPELFSGAPADDGHPPLPYPAACRPQAWSAAGVIGALTSVLGLDVDVPGRQVTVPEFVDPRLTHLGIGGLWPTTVDLHVAVAGDGAVTARQSPTSPLDQVTRKGPRSSAPRPEMPA